MLTTHEHRQTKAARNASAAVRRAANRQRVSGAIVLRASDDAGLDYTLVMVPAKEPGKAYLVTREKKTGAWVCGCFQARWRRTCEHLEAVRLLEVAQDQPEFSNQSAERRER
ncbi:MAG: hypothetical protein ACR2NO_02530 [Chloroflexota bacterium]